MGRFSLVRKRSRVQFPPLAHSIFLLSMEAAGKTPATIESYGYSTASFLEFAKAWKLPDGAEQITRARVTTDLRGR
jgi:hypothetical protein